MSRGIIIFGTMASGKTTLGRELARRLNFQHLDCDDYLFRQDTEIPLTEYHTKEHRIEQMMNDISKCSHFVMSGQMWSIRKTFEPLFDLAVFITAPTEICVERFRLRSLERWGDRVRLGGDMYEYNQDNLLLTAQYATGAPPSVCLKRDELWITELPCPVLRIDGTKPITENAMWLADQYLSLRLTE